MQSSHTDLGFAQFSAQEHGKNKNNMYNALQVKEIDRKNRMLHENMVKIANSSQDWNNPLVDLSTKRSTNLINFRLRKLNDIEKQNIFMLKRL